VQIASVLLLISVVATVVLGVLAGRSNQELATAREKLQTIDYERKQREEELKTSFE
jgi:hypothetical protein